MNKPSTLLRITLGFLLLAWSREMALAQNEVTKNNDRAATFTASASVDAVRFTAPPSAVQIRLELYNSAGVKVFDKEVRGGNVLDWRLQDGQAQPLEDDSYLCVVTVKSLSGNPAQRIGSLKVEKSSVSVQLVQLSQMTMQQAQAIGSIEESGPLTVLKEEDNQTTTIDAHNGDEGQITRGKGALSFRVGDFFSGKDIEQMRLTAEGNLGIGITHPLVKLDVDGLIRGSQGIVFPDGSIQYSAATKTYGARSSLPDPSFQSLQSKSGKKSSGGQEHIEATSQNMIPKFQDNMGTLTDSSIFDNGSVGIGVTSPIVKLDVNGGLNLRVANLYFNGALRFTDSSVYTNFVAKNGNMTNFDGVNYEQLNLYNPGGDKAIHLGQTVTGSEIASIGPGNSNLALQPNGGNVGIGKNNPQARLEVQDSTATTGISATEGSVDGTAILGQANTGANAWGIEGLSSSGLAGKFYGDVDITSYAPKTGRLSVAGGVSVGGGVSVAGRLTLGPTSIGSRMEVNSADVIGIGALVTSVDGIGIEGSASNGAGAWGIVGHSSSGLAGKFLGDVDIAATNILKPGNFSVAGTLTKGMGAFKIDHPLDPENKYLYHSFVESPDMLNLYNGVVILDADGQAEVSLPNWFEALNQDFRYQLTCIGAFAPVYIAEEVNHNRFKIAGGLAGMKVSWQVTGIRHDAFAQQHRIPVEEAKPENERGTYLHPLAFGKEREKGRDWKAMQEREKAQRRQTVKPAEGAAAESASQGKAQAAKPEVRSNQ